MGVGGGIVGMPFSCLLVIFSFFFLCRFRILSYLCTIAWLVHSWAAGGLIYEKDVFERLSLWTMNLANSYHRSRQMTTRRLRGTFLYTPILIYSSCWRGLTALSILCGGGNARAYSPRMDRRTGTHAFFVYQGNEIAKDAFYGLSGVSASIGMYENITVKSTDRSVFCLLSCRHCPGKEWF